MPHLRILDQRRGAAGLAHAIGEGLGVDGIDGIVAAAVQQQHRRLAAHDVSMGCAAAGSARRAKIGLVPA